MGREALALLPEICLLLGGLIALIGGSFLPRQRQWVARLVALAALIAAGLAAAAVLGATARTAWEASYAIDVATGGGRIIVSAAVLLVIALGVEELSGDRQESETYALLMLSGLGSVVLAGASDLMVLAVGYLLASIPLYGLVGLARSANAAEAAMKTYLLGALFGIILLLGVTILYGVAGGTTYAELSERLADAPPAAVAVGVVAVVGGLMFKAGGVPAHFWVPDAAQGASVTAAAFLTTVPKIGAVVAAYRLVGALPDTADWSLLIGVLAVASMTLGNLAAFAQTDPRRLLGWSTVSQVGYLLVPVAVAGRSDLALPSLLLYLAAYAVTNLAAFAVVAAVPDRRDLSAYRGLARSRPWLAGALLVALLGLVGTPPTGVFAGKLTTVTAVWEGGAAWLAVAVIVNTLISLFYYLRWIAPVFRVDTSVANSASDTNTYDADAIPATVRPWAARTAVGASAMSLVIGLAAGLMLTAAGGALAQ